MTSVTNKSKKYCLPSKDFDYPPLQPDIQEGFPTVEGVTPRIPHILHQTFKDEMIPPVYWENIQTVVKHHPTWKYYYWTDASARQFIRDRYPQYLKMWDGLGLGIKKSDAMRYFILYEFGGVYLDMDFEVVRPLDPTTTKYASIIAPEVFEHVVFLYDKEFILMNCFMSSRPQHPFFKYLMEGLLRTYRERDLLKATGPLFVTSRYMLFYNITTEDENRTKLDCSSNSPYFYKGQLREDDENAVYVPNTQYFNDVIDVRYDHVKRFQTFCNTSYDRLSLRKKRACSDIKRRGLLRTSLSDRPYAYTTHKWTHFWLDKNKYDTGEKRNIHALVPNCSMYPNLA